VQIAEPELAAGYPFPGPGEHLGRAVHPDDAVSSRGQVLGEPAGTARRVQGRPGGQPVEDLVHHGLVLVEQPVARLVIAVRPLPVRRHRIPASDQHPVVVRQPLVVDQPADLGQPGQDEVLVVVAGPRPQQRDAFEPQQVRQWMLVDHSPTLTAYRRHHHAIPADTRRYRVASEG